MQWTPYKRETRNFPQCEGLAHYNVVVRLVINYSVTRGEREVPMMGIVMIILSTNGITSCELN